MVFNVQDHGNQPLRRNRDVDDMKPPTVWNCTPAQQGRRPSCQTVTVKSLRSGPWGSDTAPKTGVSTTVKTATADLRYLSLTNNGHNSNLVQELHLEQEELDHWELPLRHNREVRKKAGTCRCTTKCEHTLSRNCNCGVSRNKHSKHCAYLSLFQQKPM